MSLALPDWAGGQGATDSITNDLRRHVLLLTLKSLRNRHLFVADALAVIIAPLAAFLVRFEEPRWISDNLRLVGLYLLLSVPLRLLIFYAAGMYRRLWRHASVGELKPIAVAAMGGGAVAGLVGLVVLPLFHL